MCYIFSCFGWALDFIQRTITFVLACILCYFVCIGIVVAIAAGVAYGYNYSMAEFLTFTRQDTTVYMRRGQFYDKPDFDTDKDLIYARRSEEEQSDMGPKISADYQDPASVGRSGEKSLQDSWSQARDTRRYAEVLTKFFRKPVTDYEDQGPLTRETPASAPLSPPLPPPLISAVERVSIAPNPRVVSTTLIERGASHIVMRNFKPLPSERTPTSLYPDLEMTVNQNMFYKNEDEENEGETVSDQRGVFYSDEEQNHRTKFFQMQQRPTIPSVPSLPPIAVDQKTEKLPTHVPMRHWAVTKTLTNAEPYLDYKEDVDEDMVVYKPI